MSQKNNDRRCSYMIRVFDTFAGIGAFRSAFDKVGGFEFVGWCEIDKYAQKAWIGEATAF